MLLLLHPASVQMLLLRPASVQMLCLLQRAQGGCLQMLQPQRLLAL
jgi:hypothetical protein